MESHQRQSMVISLAESSENFFFSKENDGGSITFSVSSVTSGLILLLLKHVENKNNEIISIAKTKLNNLSSISFHIIYNILCKYQTHNKLLIHDHYKTINIL